MKLRSWLIIWYIFALVAVGTPCFLFYATFNIFKLTEFPIPPICIVVLMFMSLYYVYRIGEWIKQQGRKVGDFDGWRKRITKPVIPLWGEWSLPVIPTIVILGILAAIGKGLHHVYLVLRYGNIRVWDRLMSWWEWLTTI